MWRRSAAYGARLGAIPETRKDTARPALPYSRTALGPRDRLAESVYVIDSRFDGIAGSVTDSHLDGNLIVRGSTFTNSGSADEGEVLIGTYGTDMVARLWGAKNNTHSANGIEDSGEIVVEQNPSRTRVY